MTKKYTKPILRTWQKLPVLVVGLLLLMCANVFAAANSPREQLDAAFKSLEKVTNGNLSFAATLDNMLLDAKGKLQLSFFREGEDDLFIKGEANYVVGSEPTVIPFYLTADKNGTIVYYQDKGQWYKDKQSPDQLPKKQDDLAVSPQLQQDVDGLIKKVTLGQTTATEQSYIVTIDGKKLSSVLRESVKVVPQGNDKKVDNIFSGENAKLLDNLSDFSGEVVVNRESNDVRIIRVDLSKTAVELASAVIDDVKSLEPDAKGTFKSLIAASKFTMELTGSDYNKIEKIVVPDDVVKNAKDAPKSEEKGKTSADKEDKK